MISLMHSVLTKRGRAMHTIQTHLMNILKEDIANWDEPENTKRVRNPK
jgi:hypothetical protein